MGTGVIISLSDLAKIQKELLIGELSTRLADQGFEMQRTSQTVAWDVGLSYLQKVADTLIREDPAFGKWCLLLEYEIPRRQRRPDGILLNSDILFVIEFKLGDQRAGNAERWQTEEYALDLRDFHAASHERTIIPILCTENPARSRSCKTDYSRGVVWPVQECDVNSLSENIIQIHRLSHDPAQKLINAADWTAAPYRPTLTIIEAAERLFVAHDVREISHKYADNLTETTASIVSHIRDAQATGERRICFLTGVPGAGKTLTGLNAVHDPQIRSEGRPPAVFLSGNGPLVKIIRSALVRSCQQRKMPKRQSERMVSAFIQNVHSFIRYYTINDAAPAENVIVFDEAQRAWNALRMHRKHKMHVSEPELLLQLMERCKNWCVVVALVGGGQEIHEGEAGLSEWGDALSRVSSQWKVIASGEALSGGESVAGQKLFQNGDFSNKTIHQDDRLHLRVSTRSWRAHQFNRWVNDLLALHPNDAAKHLPVFREYPIVVTRVLYRRAKVTHQSGVKKKVVTSP